MSINEVPDLKNFSEFRKGLEEQLKNINSYNIRVRICCTVACLYKTFFNISKDDQLKKDAIKEAHYFLNKAKDYISSYNSQKEMLPDFFDADRPIG